ncbi:MAG: DUF2617 family protein [Isosphaeraceae bacterium]
MGVSFGRPRAADLTFQVFGRVLHPDWFGVRSHQRIGQGGWEADVRIIEGGHAIVFRSGSVRVTEVLSGPETALPEPGLLFHSHLNREHSAVLHPGGGIEYQTCFDVERVDPEVFAHLSEEMALDARPGRIFHRFAPANRMAPAPISHLRFEARGRGLTVHAFHTFPEDGAIVRTQSLLERA